MRILTRTDRETENLAEPSRRPSHWTLTLLGASGLGLAAVTGCAATSTGEGPAEPATVPGASDALYPVEFELSKGTAALTLPAPDANGVHSTFLLVEGIETGLGANDIGLDRGQMSGAKLVRFRTVGARVLLEELNTGFRAESGSELERRAAAQSFATSVLWGSVPSEVAADGSPTVDLTGFLVRDAHGIAGTLESSGQGSYSLDRDRSALDVARCRAFPDNLEFAAVLTFSSKKAGPLARRTAPDGRALTFVQRQGFLRLPDDDFARRTFDPRMGAFSRSYLDYGVALDESLVQRLAVRHRIHRDPVTGDYEPLVYYVDRAAPEPVRSALVEGASWWSRAFTAAGYPGLFRVEVAPEGLDPLDVRNHMIQWVHRSTRGWSYGNAVSDPRTGEILKGHVSLGSLRVRQDRLLFEGLLGTQATGTGAPDDPVELALARIRQLAAHEVGHTLGLSHNFAASTRDRASVMDYPAPRVRPSADGGLDVSDAYGVGIGIWDIYAIRMLYEELPVGAEHAAFYDRLSSEARSRGLVFLTDQDARSAGAAQALANLWDDGADPVRALVDSLEVRRRALARFGRANLEEGRPMAELEEVFVPLYLHHRYQVDAAVKRVGGVVYEHAVNREGEPVATPAPAASQSEALTILRTTLSPEVLRIPTSVTDLLLPRPPGYGSSPELFDRRAGAAFDWMGAAEVAARATASGLLHPQRLMRAELQAARAPAYAALDARSVIGAVLAAVHLGPDADPLPGPSSPGNPTDRELMDASLVDVARSVVIEEGMRTFSGARTPRPVREALRATLEPLQSPGAMGTLLDLQHELREVLSRPMAPDTRAPASAAPETPPGSPIGAGWAYCSCPDSHPYRR